MAATKVRFWEKNNHLVVQPPGFLVSDRTLRILDFPPEWIAAEFGNPTNVDAKTLSTMLIVFVVGGVSPEVEATRLDTALVTLFTLLEKTAETYNDMQGHSAYFVWVANHWNVAAGKAYTETVMSIIQFYIEARLAYAQSLKCGNTAPFIAGRLSHLVSLHIDEKKKYRFMTYEDWWVQVRRTVDATPASFLSQPPFSRAIGPPPSLPPKSPSEWPMMMRGDYMPEEVMIFVDPTLRPALWGINMRRQRLGEVRLPVPRCDSPPAQVRLYLCVMALRYTNAMSWPVRLYPTPIQRFDSLSERCGWLAHTNGDTGVYASIEEFASYAKRLLRKERGRPQIVYGLGTPSCGALDTDMPEMISEAKQLARQEGAVPPPGRAVYNKRCPRMGIAMGVRLCFDVDPLCQPF
jgi:hypothetical protein